MRCAITDTRNPTRRIEILDVDLQEAYATPTAVLQRAFPNARK